MGEEKLSWQLQFDLVGDGLAQARAQMDSLQQSLAKGQKAIFDLEIGGKKVQIELQGTADKAKKAAGEVGGLGAAFDKARDQIKGFAKEHWAAIGAVTALGGLLYKGFQALNQYGDTAQKAFGERTSTIRAYTTLLGSATEAEKEFSKAQTLAAKTDLTAAATQEANQALVVSGLRGDQKDSLLKVGLDLASLSAGNKNEALTHFAETIAKIQNQGKLQGDELNSLSEASKLNTGLVKSELVSILGVKDTDAVDKLQGKGEIKSEQAFLAIRRAASMQLGTTEPGQYAMGASGSLTGLISNRDEMLENLLKSFDAEEQIPGMQRYKAALAEQAAVLDVTTVSGGNAVRVLQDLANTSITLSASWTSFVAGFVESFTESYTAAMDALGANQQGLNGLGDSANALGHILGEQVAPPLAVIIRAFDYMAPPLEIVGGLLNIFITDVETLVGVMIDLTNLRPNEAVKKMYHLGEVMLNGGYEAGKSPRELRAKRETAEAEKAEKDRLGTVGKNAWGDVGGAVGSAMAAAVEGSKGKSSKGSRGGGGLSEIYAVPNLRALIESDLAKGPISVPSVQGLIAPTYQPERVQREVRAGLRAQQAAELKVDWSGDIVIEGADKDAKEIVDEVEARILRKFGRFARTPSPAVT